MKPRPVTILWDLISRLANTTLTIRISGEPGTGKAGIARLLNSHYPHHNSVYVKFNCKTLKLQSKAPLSKTPVSGSMDAFQRILAAPQNHVLYLEHIECLPGELQDRLLYLFDRHHPAAPPWIISSSVEPLEDYVQKSDFNPHLLKALDTVHIALPPLRTQPDRIPQMLCWLLSQNNDQDHGPPPSIPDMNTLERLVQYHWPGNWQQLQRVTRAAFKAKGWHVALNSIDLYNDPDESEINEMAAIYILSLAKLNIQKERVMEGLMASSNLDEIGLLDLAIFHEAVSQIADYICTHNLDQGNKKNST
jgi:DNA-binding NtrC family response regulator